MLRLIRSLSLVSLLPLLMSCGGGSGSSEPPPPPSSLSKAGGDNQTAAPATRLAAPVQVTVLNASGAPTANVAVTFAVSGGGARRGATACVRMPRDAPPAPTGRWAHRAGSM
jgi:hypothetical protein